MVIACFVGVDNVQHGIFLMLAAILMHLWSVEE
jgi:hypothetical protein